MRLSLSAALQAAALLLALASPPALGQPASSEPARLVVRPGDRPEDVGRLVEELQRRGQRVTVQIEDGRPATVPGPSVGPTPAQPSSLGAAFREGTWRGLEGVPRIADVARAAGRRWNERVNGPGAGAPLLIFPCSPPASRRRDSRGWR